MIKEIKIGSRKIGPKFPPFIIPEIGINHNGNYNKAKKMIRDAHASGAECVKFQCHIVDDEMIEGINALDDKYKDDIDTPKSDYAKWLKKNGITAP